MTREAKAKAMAKANGAVAKENGVAARMVALEKENDQGLRFLTPRTEGRFVSITTVRPDAKSLVHKVESTFAETKGAWGHILCINAPRNDKSYRMMLCLFCLK